MIPSRYSLRRQKELLKAAQLLSTIPESEGGDPSALSRLPLSPKALLKLVKVQDRVGQGRSGVVNASPQAKVRTAADSTHQRPVGVLEDIIGASGGGNFKAASTMTKAQLKNDPRLRTFLPAALRTNTTVSDRFKQGCLSAEVSKVIWVGRPKPKSDRGLKVGFKMHGWEREAAFRKKNTETLVQGMGAKIRKFLNVSSIFVFGRCLESAEGCFWTDNPLSLAFTEEEGKESWECIAILMEGLWFTARWLLYTDLPINSRPISASEARWSLLANYLMYTLTRGAPDGEPVP
jgi:hypothetical protein